MMKALVIGLDGATFKVLTPLAQAGTMPHLRKALARGVAGELLSTIPPVTALAWPSFMTGKNPGQHGLLSWQKPLNERFERPWVSGASVHGSKLWHLAGQAGLRVCVVNVPVTYPPEAVNGTMVTGLLTPGLKASFTYPPELQAELLAAVPDYQIDVDVQHTQRDSASPESIRRLLDETLGATRARGQAMRWLLERERPDLAVLVFELPDRLQHVLWRTIEQLAAGKTSETDKPIHRGILTCYQALDEEIGRLVEKLPQDAYLVFLSDHGFGQLNTLVYIDQWLAEKGWLAYDRRRAGGRELVRQAGRLLKRRLPNGLVRQARQSFPRLRTLDWSRTQAYAGLPSEYGIFLNVRGREPAGSVEPAGYEALRTDIIAALRDWRDPRTGRPVMAAVYRREELYRGPFVANAPDIVFELLPGYKVSHMPYRGELLDDVSGQPDGFHEREGIFAMSGPGIQAGAQVARARIEDVLPTLLYALDLPVPDDLDGRVLLDIFGRPVRFQPVAQAEGQAETRAYSEEEEALLVERLKGLGYLDDGS